MSQLKSAAAIKAGDDPSAGVFAKIGIAVLLLSYGINAMDRALFPMMLTDVRREYVFTLPQAGLMSTVFTLGMALAGVPTGYLMSQYSRKAVVEFGIFIFSVPTIVTVVSAGFLDMLFYRAVTGIGEAMQLTALLAVFSSYLARHRGRGRWRRKRYVWHRRHHRPRAGHPHARQVRHLARSHDRLRADRANLHRCGCGLRASLAQRSKPRRGERRGRVGWRCRHAAQLEYFGLAFP